MPYRGAIPLIFQPQMVIGIVRSAPRFQDFGAFANQVYSHMSIAGAMFDASTRAMIGDYLQEVWRLQASSSETALIDAWLEFQRRWNGD